MRDRDDRRTAPQRRQKECPAAEGSGANRAFLQIWPLLATSPARRQRWGELANVQKPSHPCRLRRSCRTRRLLGAAASYPRGLRPAAEEARRQDAAREPHVKRCGGPVQTNARECAPLAPNELAATRITAALLT